MAVDARFIGFSHFLRGTHDFHIEGCVVASQNPNQQGENLDQQKS